MLIYTIIVFFVVSCKHFSHGLSCKWMHGYSGHSRVKSSPIRVQNEVLCITQCRSHGASDDIYAQYNFNDKNCVCLLQFISMISSSENVAICRIPIAVKTATSFDIIYADMFYSDLKYTNRSLANHVIIRKEVNSLSECFHLCFKCREEKECNCLSANFSHFKVGNKYKCEINNATRFHYVVDFVKRSGFQHYELTN